MALHLPVVSHPQIHCWWLTYHCICLSKHDWYIGLFEMQCMWDVITHGCPNFNGNLIKPSLMDVYIPRKTMGVISHACLNLSLTAFVRWVPDLWRYPGTLIFDYKNQPTSILPFYEGNLIMTEYETYEIEIGTCFVITLSNQSHMKCPNCNKLAVNSNLSWICFTPNEVVLCCIDINEH